MKKIVIIALAACLLAPITGRACAWASQNRMFPLGMCDAGLVVLETHLVRSETGVFPEFDLAWFGTAWLKVYGTDRRSVTSRTVADSLEIPESDYLAVLNRLFASCLADAARMPGFTAMKPEKVTFMGYTQSDPRTAFLSCNEENMFASLKNGLPHLVEFPDDPTDITYNIRGYYEALFAYDEDETPPEGEEEVLKFTSGLVCGRIYINSVRQFTAGKWKLSVLHLGMGDEIEMADGKPWPPGEPYRSRVPFKRLNNSIFDEPTLHHGRSFDFFILE